MLKTSSHLVFSLGLGLCAPLLPHFSAPARAQTTAPIGQIISYQGRLSDTAGAPVANGNSSLTFKIYEAGVELTPQTQTLSVATINGVFNAFLNVGALSLDPTKAYELGITFNGAETRHPIAAVPVALTAKSAVGVSGVVPITNGGTGSSTQNFVDLATAQTVAGAKTFSSAVRAPQFNIGANRALGMTPDGNSVFVGKDAGAANEGALFNVFVGPRTGKLTTGAQNVFMGDEAGGFNTTGKRNTALGDVAGINWTTGNDNIAINNLGVEGESRTTRIGAEGTHARAFIAGVRGATGLSNALPVVVDGSGQLGTGSAASLGFVDLTSAQTIAGAKSFSSAVAVPQINIGADRILGAAAGGTSVFLGAKAGSSNGGADSNVLLGGAAGEVNTGRKNVFVGGAAGGQNTTGQNNTALGDGAGFNWTTGSNNIAINNFGVPGESNTTRIGSFAQSRAFIGGIRGVAVAGTAVIIDANGQLGTVASSSGRFKQDIANIGAGSDWLMKLRPVSYRYTPAFLKSNAPSPVQYGLIAEEVAKVAPQMVQFDKNGQAEGINYGDLPVMLLSQVQQQQKQLRDRDAKIETLQAQNAAFEARLKKLEGAFAR